MDLTSICSLQRIQSLPNGCQVYIPEWYTRRKAYKCLNVNTNKVVERTNIKFDELTKVQNIKRPKKTEGYKTFIYFYEGMPNNGEVANQNDNQQQTSVSVESQIVNVELKMHLDAELYNIDNAHLDFENNTHEENEELPDGDMHGDSDVERNNMKIRKEHILEKYVRKHHPEDQIIGDKGVRPLTRNKLRSETCLLNKVKPKTISEVLQDGD